ncbi:hypothetical protein Tco_0984903 [Tanacetum coccineum]
MLAPSGGGLILYQACDEGKCEVLKEREKSRDKECVMMDFDNNPAVNVLCEKIVALSGEVKEHKASLERMLLESKKWAGYQVENVKRDRAEVVSNVVPYVAIELVYSDELGRLDGKLASAYVFYGRRAAFEESKAHGWPYNILSNIETLKYLVTQILCCSSVFSEIRLAAVGIIASEPWVKVNGVLFWLFLGKVLCTQRTQARDYAEASNVSFLDYFRYCVMDMSTCLASDTLSRHSP